MKRRNLRVCALIPAYNESKAIAEVVKGCLENLPAVLVVDDGSADDTARIAKEAGAKVIVHEVNRGKGAALKTGFDAIVKGRWDALIVVDADGQHDWNEIPKIVEKTVDENAAITIGSRMDRTEDMPIHRKMTNHLTSWIISKLSRQYVPDSQCGFRLIMTSVLKEIEMSTDSFELESEMLISAGRKGYKISSVPIRTIYLDERERLGPGRATWKFIKLFAAYILRFRK